MSEPVHFASLSYRLGKTTQYKYVYHSNWLNHKSKSSDVADEDPKTVERHF